MSLQALLGNVNIPADQKTEIMKQIQAIQSVSSFKRYLVGIYTFQL